MTDILTDFQSLKLGRLPSVPDPRTLKAENYFADDLQPPEEVNNGKWTKPPWRMFRNDEFGCCTCASLGHAIQVWTGGGGKEVEVSDQAVLDAYRVVGNGVDEGAQAIDALRYMRTQGIGGHKILAFARINPTDIRVIKLSIWLFGCAYFGIDLAQGWQGKKEWLAPKDPNTLMYPQYYPYRPGTWGGHAVISPDYNKNGHYPVTWNDQVRMSWWVHQFPNMRQFPAYVPEAYCPYSEDWIDKATKKTRYGFDANRLMADLSRVGRLLAADAPEELELA